MSEEKLKPCPLIKIAATLLKCGLSEDKDDYKFKIPNYHIREIKKQNDLLRSLAIKLRDYHDKIGTRGNMTQESIKIVSAQCPDCLRVRKMAFTKGNKIRNTWCMWCKKAVFFKEAKDQG